ncbi:MAG: hypothetical protein LBC61_05800 [Candidatus Peribacteria bacterium]|nr:hypothetical protein [Candidatus Peribacteria bacterium]
MVVSCGSEAFHNFVMLKPYFKKSLLKVLAKFVVLVEFIIFIFNHSVCNQG